MVFHMKNPTKKSGVQESGLKKKVFYSIDNDHTLMTVTMSAHTNSSDRGVSPQ